MADTALQSTRCGIRGGEETGSTIRARTCAYLEEALLERATGVTTEEQEMREEDIVCFV